MASIHITGAVRGLVSEGERVSELIETLKPEIVALSISKEGLEAMNIHIKRGSGSADLDNIEEEIYVAGLEVFGEVEKPPPCFARAVMTAETRGIGVVPLDLNDEEYTDSYCRNVSTLEVLSHGRSQRKIARHRFKATTAEEYVLEFDGLVNESRGFGRLEAEREAKIAEGIAALADGRDVMAIIEIERLAGVKKRLEEGGVEFNIA